MPIMVMRAFTNHDSAERAVVRLRAVGVPLTSIRLAGPDEDEYNDMVRNHSGPVAPGSYLVAAPAGTPEAARLLEMVLDNADLTDEDLKQLREQVPPVEPWRPVEVEHGLYGIVPEHHAPLDEGGPLTGDIG